MPQKGEIQLSNDSDAM